MEMRGKVGKYGKDTVFLVYCHNISGNFTNIFVEQTNKWNKQMRCIGLYTDLHRFLEGEERQFLVKRVLIRDRLFPAENVMS